MSKRVSQGDGLYLHEKDSGTQSWVFIYKFKGKRTERGLGSVKKLTPAAARKLVRGYRVKLDNGIDPFAVEQDNSTAPLFSVVAHDLIESLRAGWKNEKHGDQWGNTLKMHASELMKKPVDTITTEDVLATLQPIWSEKPETASRVRGRIEKVLDAAKVRGLRTGDNPARWKGHLSLLLPRRKLTSRKHHEAMPYDQVPAFVQDLHSRQALSALAMELLILTAARSGEIRHAEWSEFDLEEKLWTVPASRMKAQREHRVPLVDRAVAILKHVQFLGKPKPFEMSSNAFDNLLARMQVTDYTTHGFRSSFRDWVGEETEFPREIAEAALAHQVGDEVERAYRRGDALNKRRELMEAWAAYLVQKKVPDDAGLGDGDAR